MLNQPSNEKVRCIAVEDEPFALQIIADDIRKIPFLELVKVFSNAIDAQNFLNENTIDLIFLDIQMPTLTGIQFLKKLEYVPMVIFTTAYEQYALEGYDLSILDYLLKPIPFERFLKAANKAYELHLLKLREIKPVENEERLFFFIHSEYKQIKIFYDEILYIEGLKDYVKIFTKTYAKPILTRLNLKTIENKLANDQFCRVHQSYIVSLDKIVSFQKTKLMIAQQEIPIGRSFIDTFRTKYQDS
ncbi:LytTR family DNA-binding domain-containing protein [Emticicia sp. BO119]|uniref:LytR/AlgR family response regulator transcription factor n=1 Tax=Emticicia sp. BO119 TaxID=2757768 RepID=UPI0015F1241A|nr:LytTR family DNA-binding domain-containing protein [Emticicia sp. BO119]MBA4853288.1 response regulator transcription factor [Emticicia sp. BO119]